VKFFAFHKLHSQLFLIILVFHACNSYAQQAEIFGMHSDRGSLWVGAEIGPSLLVEKAPDTCLLYTSDAADELDGVYRGGGRGS
jgi:hypothetical protein